MIQTVLVPVAPSLTANGENLPITGISAKGKIHPVLATIELTQEFVNGNELADVTYHAPIHPDWAVRAVTMTCDDRTIRTVVLPEQKAQETFDQAKEEGHTAILAKEFTPDEMQLQLANVPANARVTVTSEVVAWPTVEKNRGTILIPLVNGPRYGGSEAQQSFFDADDVDGRKAMVRLDLELNVENASVDVGTIDNDRISCEIAPVGQITVEFDAKPTALYHEDESGRYLVVGVPAVRPENAPDWGRTAIVVDRSMSMAGIGIHSAVDVARAVHDRIGENITDAFMFDSSCEHVWPSARTKGINAADAIASHGTPGYSTEMRMALNHVMSKLKGKIDNIILVTDALVQDDQISTVAREIADRGVAVHVVLVSTAPSRYVAEAISTAGGGFFMDLSGGTLSKDRIEDGIARFLLGGANLDAVIVDGRRIPCKLPVRGRPLMIPVQIDSRPNAVSVIMDGTEIAVPVKDRPEAEFIWAREIVMGIVRDSLAKGDMHFEESRNAIEKVGVDHQILTPFTSFVGFDASEKFDRSSVREMVAQMSLPQGIDAGQFHGLPKGGTLDIGGGTSYTPTYNFSFAAAPQQMYTPPQFYSPHHTPTAWKPGTRTFGSSGRGLVMNSMMRADSRDRVESVVAQSLTSPGIYSDTRPAGGPIFSMTLNEVTTDNRGDDSDNGGFLYVRANAIDSDFVAEDGSPESSFFLSVLEEDEHDINDEAAALLATIAQSLEDGNDPFEGTLLAGFGRNAIVLAATVLYGLPSTPGLASIINRLAHLASNAPDVTTINVQSGAYDVKDQADRLAKVA